MPKKIIICADGTWNTQDDADNGMPCPTNVECLARALRSESAGGVPQVVYYHSGVGTNWGFSLRGGALGRGLWANVLDCYRFLVHNYCQGDQLYIFGFSRGAYTARSLAGLVRNSGILARGHEDYENEAVALYRDNDPSTAPDSDRCKKLRAEHSVEAETEIDFIGVWDTVGALGIPGLSGSFHFLKHLDWAFHDVNLSHKVKRARQAFAIHEHRMEFLPTKWELQPDDTADPQKLKQVWFTGAHSDVGGGYPAHGLSDVALRWMLDEAKEAGLSYGMDALPHFAADGNADPHDSFSTIYKVIDFFRGHPKGAGREWKPSALTGEDIHPSVVERYQRKIKGDFWPETFEAELKRRTGGR